MKIKKLKNLANVIVNDIIADLTDRVGLRQEWERISNINQSRIKKTWVKIVYFELLRHELDKLDKQIYKEAR